MKESEIKKLAVDVTRDEHFDLKRKALDARVTLTKYVRLKLGLDRESKEKSK